MTVAIFVGPTLPASDVLDLLDATILPPVQQGQVYRAVQTKPQAIGIIDGFFDGVPSVWHKEILWAMEQGIPVYGSASMGALRAAELAKFGMIGVGRVFQDYLSGAIEDDDEVAVLHSPAELGFQPLSEPMVSVRATVAKALMAGVLTEDNATNLLGRAKSLNYRDRIWDRILDTGVEGLAPFRQWLPQEKVDIKADDAREMLLLMARDAQQGDRAVTKPARVERTLAWRELCARVESEPAEKATQDQAVLDELRLNPSQYTLLRDQAAMHLLARDDAEMNGHRPDRDALVAQMAKHRAEAGLPRQSDLMRWLEENDLTLQRYEAHLADRSRSQAAIDARNGQLDPVLLDELKRSGRYVMLKERAQRKAALEPFDAEDPARHIRMLIWYFETRLDQEVPDDLESYARALGLDGRDKFVELIEAEYAFCHLNGSPDEGGPSD